MRNSAWVKLCNSFGFITFVVFTFAFLTTVPFIAMEGDGKWARGQSPAQPRAGLSSERFETTTVPKDGESIGHIRAIRGHRPVDIAYYR